MSHHPNCPLVTQFEQLTPHYELDYANYEQFVFFNLTCSSLHYLTTEYMRHMAAKGDPIHYEQMTLEPIGSNAPRVAFRFTNEDGTRYFSHVFHSMDALHDFEEYLREQKLKAYIMNYLTSKAWNAPAKRSKKRRPRRSLQQVGG